MAQTNFLDKYSGLRSLGLDELNQIWAHYDEDRSGYIEIGPELDRFLADLMRAGGMQASGREVEEFKEGVLEMFDANADGRLDFAEVEQLLNG